MLLFSPEPVKIYQHQLSCKETQNKDCERNELTSQALKGQTTNNVKI